MSASVHTALSTGSEASGARPPVQLLLSIVGCTAIAAMAAPSARAQGDTWSGPWDWECQVDPEPGIPLSGSEISHAALIPHGLYRGKVLMWRAPRNVPTDPPQTESWIFDPAHPAILLKVEQSLVSDIFCSSMSWDKDGQLVVAGGAPGGSPPNEAYRFYPALLQPPMIQPLVPCKAIDVEGAPWRNAGEMSIGRYYPTLITLFKGDILGTPVIGGASSFVLGGFANFGTQSSVGNDYWQLLEPTSITWSRTLHSPAEKFTHPAVGGTKEQYELKSVSGLSVPYPYLENYPRIFQLTNVGQSPDLYTKNLFIANDVWPDTLIPFSPAGDAWVVRPRYAGGPSTWELWTAESAATPGSQSIDRYYGSATLLHTEQPTLDSNGKNRVLVFGGRQDESGSKRINPTVQEFRPGIEPANPNIPNGGKWIKKTTGLTYPRMYSNAITLPTGDILIVGGLKECPCDANKVIPEHRPELYNPGNAGQGSGASTTVLSPGNVAAPGYAPYARGYHQVALLLPDGRVFNAGGAEFLAAQWDCFSPCLSPNYKSGMYSGEVYSPPYMSYSPRPSIGSAPASISFGTGAFTVRVDHDPAYPIDRFVLLRPAAVTHHFDNDQRYIELPFASAGVSGTIETFNVDSPSDDMGPPGYYMLFAVRDLGSQQRVPSAAHWLKIE
jgi:hypothetical protein